MNLSLIAALGARRELGQAGHLLCHLPDDLRHFRTLTSGSAILMGRRTFDSLPSGPLPHRTNIVLSRNPDFRPAGVVVYSSFHEALARSAHLPHLFVIGGAEVYAQALPSAHRLYLTLIEASFPAADTFFPEIPRPLWREVRRCRHPADHRHPYAFSFVELHRRWD